MLDRRLLIPQYIDADLIPSTATPVTSISLSGNVLYVPIKGRDGGGAVYVMASGTGLNTNTKSYCLNTNSSYVGGKIMRGSSTYYSAANDMTISLSSARTVDYISGYSPTSIKFGGSAQIALEPSYVHVYNQTPYLFSADLKMFDSNNNEIDISGKYVKLRFSNPIFLYNTTNVNSAINFFLLTDTTTSSKILIDTE